MIISPEMVFNNITFIDPGHTISCQPKPYKAKTK